MYVPRRGGNASTSQGPRTGSGGRLVEQLVGFGEEFDLLAPVGADSAQDEVTGARGGGLVEQLVGFG
jgi:hypothetical protein